MTLTAPLHMFMHRRPGWIPVGVGLLCRNLILSALAWATTQGMLAGSALLPAHQMMSNMRLLEFDGLRDIPQSYPFDQPDYFMLCRCLITSCSAIATSFIVDLIIHYGR